MSRLRPLDHGATDWWIAGLADCLSGTPDRHLYADHAIVSGALRAPSHLITVMGEQSMAAVLEIEGTALDVTKPRYARLWVEHCPQRG